MQLLLRGGANAEAWPTPRQLQIEQTGAGSTVKYHGMYVAYVASDALVKLLGMRAENARSCAECLLR